MQDIELDKGDEVKDLEGDIKLENVCFAYQSLICFSFFADVRTGRPNNKVLKGVNLTIRKGSVVALVGKSGGGKSTLVHLLMRFYDPTSGTISVDGKDLRTLNLKSLRKHMGFVAQETQLFDQNIGDNIACTLCCCCVL